MHTLLTFDTHDPVFWVSISFLLFLGLLAYNGVPALIGKSLDARADAIRKELDEARRLREEAQALLADYQKKAKEAENEAASIIDAAKREAEALAAEARKSLIETIERRSKIAEDKIARAEAQALSEVRSTAVATAMSVAETLIGSRVGGATGINLIDQSIKDLKGKLN
ncbi:MAG: F0F1 ATP synthase subunit B [Hyphomicrobium sp.]|nr:F0F1 ATP synthase subunit B [Hyphomicrobium sp.]